MHGILMVLGRMDCIQTLKQGCYRRFWREQNPGGDWF